MFKEIENLKLIINEMSANANDINSLDIFMEKTFTKKELSKILHTLLSHYTGCSEPIKESWSVLSILLSGTIIHTKDENDCLDTFEKLPGKLLESYIYLLIVFITTHCKNCMSCTSSKPEISKYLH